MHPDTTTAVRMQLIAALERRAAKLEGAARRALEARLDALRALDADAPNPTPCTHPDAPPPARLRDLVDRLADAPFPGRETYPELPALADFRQLWTALRADRQLEQSVAHAPTDAGPLNSTALASRAIALMRDLSPAYLRSFLAYVDDLAWLEQWGGAGPAIGAGGSATKKRTRRKTRE